MVSSVLGVVFLRPYSLAITDLLARKPSQRTIVDNPLPETLGAPKEGGFDQGVVLQNFMSWFLWLPWSLWFPWFAAF